MYESIIPKRARAAYRQSRFKQRMDLRATKMLERGYSKSRFEECLREWVDFALLYEDAGKPLPTDVRSAEVIAYLDRRCVRRREGHISVRAMLRLFLHEDAENVHHLPLPRKATTALFDEYVPAYIDYARRHRGRRSTRGMQWGLRLFFDWLEQAGIDDIQALTGMHIRDFISQQGHLKRSSIGQVASIVRCFLRYIHMRGVVEADIPNRVDSPILYKWSQPPVALSDDTVKQLLAAVDRSTPLGKRDYAILLLGARYGLRASDIRILRLDQIHWREQYIILIQSKPQRPLELPLLADVDYALVDYIRNGRPASTAPEVFLRYRAPHVSLSTLNNVFFKAFRAAGIRPPASRFGFHLLRHSAATSMLKRGVTLDTISDVLGHASVETTRIYTQVDLNGLRSVSMSAAEVYR